MKLLDFDTNIDTYRRNFDRVGRFGTPRGLTSGRSERF